ncbi:MAG: hypothetical protein ACMXX8_01640 [Candidatus Woesearchaeota archaeon]
MKYKKAISTMEYFFGAVSTILLLVFLVVLFNILFTSCSHQTTYYMNERQLSNLHKESLYLFLMSPIDNPNSFIPYSKNIFFYENDNILRHYSLPLDLSNNPKFQIFVEDFDKISSIYLNFNKGNFSNVALINGSLDHVMPFFERSEIYPDIITWDNLNENHNYVIAGCSSPMDYNKIDLLNWIENGGKLITTDHSIKIIEDLFGKKYIYSSDNLIRRDEVEISFKSNSNNIIGSTGRFRIKDFYSLAIKNQSNALAEYENIDNEYCINTYEGCGYPVHNFNYGSGEIIHFTFHLDSNVIIAKNLFNTFIPDHNAPSSFTLYDEFDNELIKIENFNSQKKIDLIDYFNDCEVKCNKTFTIKGNGNLLLNNLKTVFHPSTYSYNQITISDYIIYAFSNNDDEMINHVKDKIDSYIDSISTEAIVHKVIFSNKSQGQDEIFHLISEKYKKNWVTAPSISIAAEHELKLYNNQSIFITVDKALTTSSTLDMMYRTIMNFILPGVISWA